MFKEGSPSAIVALQGDLHFIMNIHDIKPCKVKEKDKT